MRRTLTPDSSLETLKKEAKRWLKALRAGDEQARQRLVAATPAATGNPSLRDVQLALAREHGLPGWAALRTALDDLAIARHSIAGRVDIVLRSAWGGDPTAAARILIRWPEIAAHNLYIAAATGNLAEVERRLTANPGAAIMKGGPLDWEPLLYVAYARLPSEEKHTLDLVRTLLDHGANPNAQFDDGWGNPFKVLTGVIGQGEGDKPPHPQANELALLLIERGADPYDSQALYNTSITRDDTRWLDFLWTWSDQRDRLGKWRGSGWLIKRGRSPVQSSGYALLKSERDTFRRMRFQHAPGRRTTSRSCRYLDRPPSSCLRPQSRCWCRHSLHRPPARRWGTGRIRARSLPLSAAFSTCLHKSNPS